MTAHRRPLLLSAAAAALLLPACLVIPVQPGLPAPAEKRDKPPAPPKTDADQFASLRPGTVVPTNPAARDAATARKTAGTDATAEPPGPPPPNALETAGGPPGPFPPIVPPPAAEPTWLRFVRAHAEGHPDRAMGALQALDPLNQELLLALVPALSKLATTDLAADPTAAAVLAEQLRAATARLEQRAALRVENVVLCRWVDGFGRYNPRPIGQPYHPNDQAQLYLEVRNLGSEPAPGPNGETHLTRAGVAVEVRDAHGNKVEQPDNGQRRVRVVQYEKQLRTRGPVHDFHLLHPFPVPTTPGVYTVTVEVRDPAGRAARSAPVEFRVSGQ